MKPVFSYKDWNRKKTTIEKIKSFFLTIKKKSILAINKNKPSKKNIQHNFRNIHTSSYPLENSNLHKETDINFDYDNNIVINDYKKMKIKNNKRKKKNDEGKFKRILKTFLKIFTIFIILTFIVLLIIFIQFSKELPEPGKINTRFIPESTKIYDKTGKTLLYEIHGEEKRTLISLDEIPDTIKHATISLEDRHFYEHHGILPKAILRAALSQVFHFGTPSGGSTITQQLVKNSILTDERSIARKIKEAILAIQIEMKFSKEEILGMYLNEIPYGSNAYGIEAAAQTFFNKSASKLTIDEATILASLPQAPSRYSPYGSRRELLKGRQEWAIEQMTKLGFISREEAETSKQIDVFKKLKKNTENMRAPHFVTYVRDEIEEMYGEEYLQNNGLTIITTLDWEKQQIAEKIVKEKALENEKEYNAENAALVAITPETGAIISMVGSRDYFDTEIDGNVNVAISDRQPGSSFKPYVFLLSFIKGYTPETILFDVETHFPILDQSKDYTPQNYSGTFRGPVKIKDALAMSLNIPAVKALYLVGIPDTIEFAKSLGISSLTDTERYGLSLVLGGGEVKLVDHVGAFSILANNGVKNKKHAIAKILNKHGELVFENLPDEEPEQLVEEKYIGMLSHILSTNKYRIPAFGSDNMLKFDDRQVAAKTGTTNNNHDAWTVGYTPDIAVGVWTGNNDNSRMNSRGVGSNVAAPIFRAFILEAYPKPSDKTFPKYLADQVKTNKDILDGKLEENKKQKICQVSKKKDKYCYINKYCPKDRIKKRRIIKTHNILHYVKKDDPLADEPKNPEEDLFYKSWEDGVIDYFKGEEKTVFASEIEDCVKDDFNDYRPNIEFDDTYISSNVLSISVNASSPFEIKELVYKINGNEIRRTDSKKINHILPNELNNSSIRISVTVIDEADNKESVEKNIDISFEINEEKIVDETPA